MSSFQIAELDPIIELNVALNLAGDGSMPTVQPGTCAKPLTFLRFRDNFCSADLSEEMPAEIFVCW